MPELRVDALSGLRAIIAAERASRPGAGLRAEPAAPIDPDSDPRNLMLVLTAPWIRMKLGVPTWRVTLIVPVRVRMPPIVTVPEIVDWM